MSNPFFDKPILNSPYECPQQHWQLDDDGQPTQKVEDFRRKAKFITPIPKPKKRKRLDAQDEMVFDEELARFHAQLPYIGAGVALAGPTLIQWGTEA